MIFTYLKKQREKRKKVEILKTMIVSLQISETQKDLYISALDIIEEDNIEKLYTEITFFVENIEMTEIEEIKKTNFLVISGMRKSEAEEKKKELNTFSFLINNI